MLRDVVNAAYDAVHQRWGRPGVELAFNYTTAFSPSWRPLHAERAKTTNCADALNDTDTLELESNDEL